MQSSLREFELKFELADDELQQIRSKRLLREIGVGRPVTRLLRSTYFDTADCALRDAGLSLRVRRDHDAWLQTVKEDSGNGAGISDRFEIESPVDEQAPHLGSIKPKRIRKRIKKAVAGKALEPVFETVVRRTTRLLRTPDGSEVELALDKGEIRGPHRLEPIREAELELKSGCRQSVFALAKELCADEPLQLSQMSKAARGYRLVGRLPAAALEPRHAQAPHLTREQTAEQAFRQILRSCNDQVLHNIRVVLESDDPEGPHQLRIGLRRLRSALRAYQPLGDKAVFRRLNAEARDLARIVGELRDVDVVIDEFVLPHAEHDPVVRGIKALLKDLRSHRGHIHDEVRRYLASARVRAFHLDLCAFMEGDVLRRPGDGRDATAGEAPVGDHAGLALHASWRRPSRLGKRLDQLSIDERHQMRRALKYVRYLAEFYAPLYPRKAVRRYVRHLKRLQNVFGYLNDVAVTENMRDVCGKRGSTDADVYWALGYIHGLNEMRAGLAWENARSRWHELNKVRPFWS